MVNSDILQHQPLADCVKNGYEVTSVSGFSTPDNKNMCLVLLSDGSDS